MLDPNLQNIIVAFIPFLLGTWYLLSPQSTSSRPSDEALEYRFSQRLPPLPPLPAPEAHLPTGLALMTIALWQLLDLPFPSLVFGATVFSLPFSLLVGTLVAYLRPDTRSSLKPALTLLGLLVAPIVVISVWPLWKGESLTGNVVAFLTLSKPLQNLPYLTQLWMLALFAFSLWMLLKGPGKATPIEARQLGDGQIAYWPPVETGAPVVSRAYRTLSPSSYSGQVHGLPQRASSSIVGYEDPQEPDCRKAGLIVLHLALMHIFSSLVPAVESSALIASVPLFIIVGVLLIFLGLYNETWGSDISRVFAGGVVTILYGLALGHTMGNYSGRIP